MRPHVYLDLQITIPQNNPDSIPPLVRGELLMVLHRIFTLRPDTYALFVPEGKRSLRVFASNEQDLVYLASRLNSFPKIQEVLTIGAPTPVPTDFTGPWTSFVRYRIPSLSSDRKTGDEHGQLRQRRMAMVNQSQMEHFHLESKSTKQAFTLFVERMESHDTGADCTPNSYGFSTSTKRFSLPALP